MTTVDYDDIYNMTLEDNIYGNDDDYDKLMSKEKVVLDTLNRIVNQKEEQKANNAMLDSSVRFVVYKIFVIMKNVISELYKRKPIDQIFNPKRRLYIGIFVVFVSVCFIILYKGF